MDNALTMDQHIHLFQGQVVQLHGFDHFQALVHQGGAVYGDLGAHLPVGMPQGIVLGNPAELLPVHAEEGTPGAGQDQSADLRPVPYPHQALENRGVLRIHRHNFRPAPLCLGHNQLTGTDQGFLVGKTDALSRTNGSQSWLQSQHTHNRRDDAVRITPGSRGQQAFFPPHDPGRKIADQVFQCQGTFPGACHRQLRPEFTALFGKSLNIGSRGQGTHPDLGIHTHHIQALPPDGAGGTENTDTVNHMLHRQR